MKILLIDTIHPAFNRIVEKKGFLCEDGSSLSVEEIIECIHTYTGMVIRSRFDIDKRFIDAATQLKFIARAGAGMENINVEYAKSKGIRCINSPEGNRNAVAEHALGMLLSLLNNLNKADYEVRHGIWKREENRGTELDGQIIGIIGFGNTGSSLVKKLSGFDVRILAYDPFITIDTTQYPNVNQVAMEEIFTHAGILSLHVPLTSETDNLVNSDFISRFSKKIILINTSRGRVVSSAAVAAALEADKIAGACLDVFDFEDSSFETADTTHSEGFEYLQLSNRVVLSPHIAGWSHQSNEKISRVLAEKVIGLEHHTLE